MKKIKSVGFFVNTTKANAASVVEGVYTWLEARGIVPLLPDEQASALGRTSDTPISRTEVVQQADVMLVLGGDGTLLSAAHTPKIENVPILAINIGTLGFLTDASLDELYPTLESLLTGDYRIEHRMMLEVVVDSQGFPEPFRAFALNDVVIRHYTRLIELDAYIDGELFIPYNADGLIIATPSGSTGYSLSCAGTIVEPQLEAILLTPIAPHSLTVRPFIAHGEAEITVKMRAAYQSVDVFVDGQRETHSLTAGAVIKVEKAERTIQLIRSQHHSYYKALREKLMLGESVRNVR
ncbi:NAD(+) kinase [Candidatus Poribacteria bacterium]|nr:NAD(+) kinase [Candidatus Poribacteria bacterium]MYK16958.1 NAD(+) kinase [Candidatus Poribacteria bacterium]